MPFMKKIKKIGNNKSLMAAGVFLPIIAFYVSHATTSITVGASITSGNRMAVDTTAGSYVTMTSSNGSTITLGAGGVMDIKDEGDTLELASSTATTAVLQAANATQKFVVDTSEFQATGSTFAMVRNSANNVSFGVASGTLASSGTTYTMNDFVDYNAGSGVKKTSSADRTTIANKFSAVYTALGTTNVYSTDDFDGDGIDYATEVSMGGDVNATNTLTVNISGLSASTNLTGNASAQNNVAKTATLPLTNYTSTTYASTVAWGNTGTMNPIKTTSTFCSLAAIPSAGATVTIAGTPASGKTLGKIEFKNGVFNNSATLSGSYFANIEIKIYNSANSVMTSTKLTKSAIGDVSYDFSTAINGQVTKIEVILTNPSSSAVYQTGFCGLKLFTANLSTSIS